MISFGSLNNYIKPYSITTPQGKLNIREATADDYRKAAAFSTDTSAESFEDWAAYFKEFPEKRIGYIDSLELKYKKNMEPHKNPNSTLLIAEDEDKNIRALFNMRPYNELKGLEDNKIGYVEECFVDKTFRNQGIGAKLFDRLIQTAKGQFTDIFLEADKKAVKLYLRAGFKPLDKENPVIIKFLERLMDFRNDDFIPMSKPVGGDTRWWQRLSSML